MTFYSCARTFVTLAMVALMATSCAPKNGSLLDRNITKTVVANKKTKIGWMFALNPDCTTRAFPTVKIVKQPTNGTVSVGTISDYPSFISFDARASCNKKKAAAQVVYYTPTRDYKGPDGFVYDLYSDAGKESTVVVKVTVE